MRLAAAAGVAVAGHTVPFCPRRLAQLHWSMLTSSCLQAMDDMKAQGVDPSNVMSELMSDPEIMQLFMKPHVTEALMAIQKDPTVAVNYMSDPDVSKLMTKMMAIQSKQGGGMPMAPGGMPMPPGAPGAGGQQ